MNLSGNYGPVGTGETKPFPDSLLLVLQTSLVNVTGTYNEKGDFQPDPSTVTDANQIVIVEPGKLHPVAIDFTKATPTFANASGGTLSTDQLAFIDSFIGKDIGQHFLSQGYQLYIVGISNTVTPPDDSTINLTPQAFRFSVVRGDTVGAPGTLCMWISVKGGAGNGLNPSNNTSVTFHPDSYDVSPIPNNSSASIIFSHNLMANQFFLVSLPLENTDLII